MTLPPVDELIALSEFRVALREFQRTTERVARASGLTPRRQLLLLLVEGAPDGSRTSTVGELSERLHLGQSTVTELVSRAVEAGLLARSAAEHDGRVTHLRLTPTGRRRLARTFELLRAEREQLQAALERLGGMRAG